MASCVELPSEGNDTLKGMSTQLAVLLTAPGEKERKAWEELHDKLADVATSIADPTKTIQDLLSKLEMKSLVLGYPEAELFLRLIMRLVVEKVRAESAHASNAISLLKTLILLLAGQLNMVPLCNSEHLGMIDECSTFSRNNVDDLVNYSLELSAPKAPYTVVSIVGAIGSGKSYLLNNLFGTKFPVMDPTFGRRQTTKGILMSRCIEPSILVLDIEGFDGGKKETDTLFEKKAALFALTVSNLMMVNISYFDIGRVLGGARSLFKTIFLERKKLPPGLTKIVVVIRNYDGEIPLEILTKDFIEAMEEIWESLNEETFGNYIEIHVVGLPEKDQECFQNAVTTLRKLLPRIATEAKVPASSFSVSSNILWDQIKKNKTLDLRSHMMTIATLYCQQTVKACVEQFDYKLLKAQETPQGFKEASDTLLSNIKMLYDQETEMYDADVREEERQKMVDEVNKIIKYHSGELLRKIQEDTSAKFKDESRSELETLDKNDDVINYDEDKVESCVDKFITSCEDLKVYDLENFQNNCNDLRKQLTIDLVLLILSLKEKRARKAAEKQQRSDKKIEVLTMNLDEMTKERQILEEDARKAAEEQQRSEEKIEVLTSNLYQMTQKSQGLEENARKADEKQQGSDEKIEMLTVNLNQMTQERQEDARKAAENLQGSEEKIKVLTMNLDEITRQKQGLEEDGRKAAEEQRMADINIELLTKKLDKRTKERQGLEEDVRKAGENQQRSDGKIEQLTMNLNQITQVRQELEEDVRKAAEELQKADMSIELLTTKLDERTKQRLCQEVEILRKENAAT